MNRRPRSLASTLALALLVAMAAIAASFGAHAPVARADNWVINITIDNTGGIYSGFQPCSGCAWPGMTLQTPNPAGPGTINPPNQWLDQYGQWSACCANPNVGDYVPFDDNENPNYNNGNGPGTSYTANAPFAGHGTSGSFTYRFDQPVVNIATGAMAVYLYVSWDVTDIGIGGAQTASCQYEDANYNAINTDCYAGYDQANGGCNVPPDADYCFEFDTSCTPVLFNCADGPPPPSALAGSAAGIPAASPRPATIISGNEQTQPQSGAPTFLSLKVGGYEPGTEVTFTCRPPSSGECSLGGQGSTAKATAGSDSQVSMDSMQTTGAAGTYTVSVTANGYRTLTFIETVTSAGGTTPSPTPAQSRPTEATPAPTVAPRPDSGTPTPTATPERRP